MSPFPNFKNIARVGGADLQLRPGMSEKYIPYTPRWQVGEWKAEWFYIDNHAPALPRRIPGPPQQCTEWYNHGQIKVQEDELLQRIVGMRNMGVTGATVVFSWLGRQIQPLQKHCHLGFEYSGLTDPS